MTHTFRFDGELRVIDVRLMDESFIVFRKMYTPPLTPENIGKISPGDPSDIIREFFRKQIRTIGSCGVLAWDREGVIGKMYFTTKELYETFRKGGYFRVGYYCAEHEGMPGIIRSMSDEDLDRLLASPSKTLRIGCFNIGHSDERYHGKGIASAMIDLLKRWGSERGWKRLETLSYPDVVPRSWAPHILRRGALERRGFHIVKESKITAEEMAERRAYLNLDSELDKEFDRKYLMVFDL